MEESENIDERTGHARSDSDSMYEPEVEPLVCTANDQPEADPQEADHAEVHEAAPYLEVPVPMMWQTPCDSMMWAGAWPPMWPMMWPHAAGFGQMPMPVRSQLRSDAKPYEGEGRIHKHAAPAPVMTQQGGKRKARSLITLAQQAQQRQMEFERRFQEDQHAGSSSAGASEPDVDGPTESACVPEEELKAVAAAVKERLEKDRLGDPAREASCNDATPKAIRNFCTQCGGARAAQAKFCRFCGTAFGLL